MATGQDLHLYVVRDIVYLILENIPIIIPTISEILYHHTLHPKGLFHNIYVFNHRLVQFDIKVFRYLMG